MSLFFLRLVATFLVAGNGLLAASGVPFATASGSTWAATGALPEKLDSPVFALAVDPADGRRMLVGAESGAIYLSLDNGVSWRPVRGSSGGAVLALAFDPAVPGALLAGTRGAGILRSADGGASWQPEPGSEGRTVRAFSFLSGTALAASDKGVLSSRSLGPWSSAGLVQVRISALAVLPASDAAPVGTVVAGGDATQGGEPLPLFSSVDGGQTWAAMPVTGPAGVVGGSGLVAALAGGPATGQVGRALLMGTNTGLFATTDRGVSWQQLTGGGVLPATDFTSLAVPPRHPDRFYVASDGGGSDQGGIWMSSDAGGHFVSLAPPLPEVTAMALTNDDTPTLVVATLRPTDHEVAIWTYRDTGGQPQGPVASLPSPPTAPSSARGAQVVRPARSQLAALAGEPETPYLVLGAGALAILLLAAVAYLRRGRQL